jgi:hypothetical protein
MQSDTRKDTGGEPPPVVADGGAVETLGREYAALQNRLQPLEVISRVQSGTADWTPAAELTWLAEVDPIRDRMFAIAAALSGLAAGSAHDVHTKAKVLLDLSSGDDGDVVYLLAARLCSDILAQAGDDLQ